MKNYKKTKIACYLGFITQAIAANFAPLLFLKFHTDYNISLGNIALISTCFFFTQLVVDLFCAKFVDRIGYRTCIVASEVCSALGLVGLAFLPDLLLNPYTGIIISVIIYAIGSGLIEVLCSPIVEACPFENKEATMSLLHSFYCWGHVLVIICSTIFFTVFGLNNWGIMACIWAVIPLLNAFYFSRVPVPMLVEEGEGMKVGELVKNGVFWKLFLMMLCAGASEQGMSQWASAFAESSLHISKTVGDLAGPCSFAIMMGLSRAFYGKFGESIKLESFMNGSSILCIISYCLASLTSNPVFGLIGCALCGLSVGIMWPGTFSIAAKSLRRGGTAMFALLALAGDLGCGSGPAVVGYISEAWGGSLQKGLLAAIIFPVLLMCCNMGDFFRKVEKGGGI